MTNKKITMTTKKLSDELEKAYMRGVIEAQALMIQELSEVLGKAVVTHNPKGVTVSISRQVEDGKILSVTAEPKAAKLNHVAALDNLRKLHFLMTSGYTTDSQKAADGLLASAIELLEQS